MLVFKIISTQYVVKHLNTCSTACVITTVLNTLYESVLMFSTPMLCQIGISNPPPTIENMNIKGKCVSKGCMKWTCPIYHTSDFHDGCPRKCFNHFLKDTSFYVCFYIAQWDQPYHCHMLAPLQTLILPPMLLYLSHLQCSFLLWTCLKIFLTISC